LEVPLSEAIRVGAGRACLSFEPSVIACLSSASEAAVSSLKPERRALSLRHGQVLAKLDPQPAGMTFRIETPRGAAVAKGTVFAVEVSENRDVLLRVHEGTVLWQGRDGREQSLRAPSEARFSDETTFGTLSGSSAERDEALIRLSGLVSAQSRCRLEVTTTPAGARVSLDGTELGPAPISAMVSGGHRLSVEQPGYVALSERLWLNGSAPVSRSYQLLALPAAAAPASAAPSAAVESGVTDSAALASASELLSRARALRAAGRSADAAGAYRRLLSAYPRSAEARASLVSLGELLLSELGDPAGALRSFDSYLKTAGALAPEARYGRIRALGKLGRLAAERAAIEQFLLDYPHSVQATSLKAKLASLR
jgi:TolA-binding protein